MLTGGSHLNTPSRRILTNYFREIHIPPGRIHGHLPRLPVCFRIPNEKVLRQTALQYPQYILQRFHPVNLRSGVVHRLQGGRFRQDTSPEPHLHGKFHHGKGPAHIPHASVKAQLSHNEVLTKHGHLPLTGRRHYPQRYGDVVAAALLVHIGRCQIDDYFLARHMVAQRLEGRHGAEEALFDGGIGKAHKVYPNAKGDIDLNVNEHGLYADNLCGIDIYKHY